MPSQHSTWASRERNKVRFGQRWTTHPAIVAEALTAVPDALVTALNPGPPVSGAVVASILARSIRPAEDPAPAPTWLLPEQVRSFRRVLAAIHRYGGAVLADPVGSGKTYVALAVAAAVNRGPTVCLVPATLLAQWEITSARLGVAVTLCSHEQVSRGTLPRGPRGLVIIDESHHFRNPATKRYRHLAPWLVRRSALLVTATPIVNRGIDLAHQLLLAVRDDALIPDGVSSLRAALAAGCPIPSLGKLVFEAEAAIARPRVLRRSIRAGKGARTLGDILPRLSRLKLSKSEPVGALIRGVLLRALASSPAALAGALRRYRRLLLNARDAMQAGQRPDRTELRRFTGELGDQLVWWELLPSSELGSDIDLSDLDQLDPLIRESELAAAAPDEKLTRLRRMLQDLRPTLIFTGSRDTVRYLRRRLAPLRIAWCTGERAGIGNTVMSRRIVLGWFRDPTPSGLAPCHLVVTDVAAEGLDLHRAARVIHYDLPWTPMRLEQREGRSARYGSRLEEVEAVQFALPPALEHRLGIEATLARKVKLPARVGIGPAGRQVWRWRAELGGRFGESTMLHGVASVPFDSPGLLAGFALHRPGESDPISTTVLWLEPDGRWSEDPDLIEMRLEMAANQDQVVHLESARLREWLSLLCRPIRERLALTQGRRWIVPEPSPAARRAMRRIHSLIAQAARRHQPRILAELERALAFVAGGHTAGEAALIERLADDPTLATRLAGFPSTRFSGAGLDVRVTGLALFGPAQGTGDALASGECPGFRPHSSISTEP